MIALVVRLAAQFPWRETLLALAGLAALLLVQSRSAALARAARAEAALAAAEASVAVRDSALAALTAESSAAIARTRRTQELTHAILQAPAADDAPLAPVLRAALDRLRQPPGAAR